MTPWKFNPDTGKRDYYESGISQDTADARYLKLTDSAIIQSGNVSALTTHKHSDDHDSRYATPADVTSIADSISSCVKNDLALTAGLITKYTLPAGNGYIHSTYFYNGKLYCGLRCKPAKFIIFNDPQNDLSNYSIHTFANDGKHEYLDSFCYDETQDKMYLLFYSKSTNPWTGIYVTEYDPIADTYTDRIADLNFKTGSGAITSDGSYLYIIANEVPSKILKYSLSTFTLALSATINDGTSDKNNGHAIAIRNDYTGTWLFATGASAPAWIAKISADDLSHTVLNAREGENYITDDICIDDNGYLNCGLENMSGTVFRIDTSSFDAINRFYTNLRSNNYGVYYDGVYVWYCYNTTPGILVRIQPYTGEMLTYTMPSGYNTPNEIVCDGTYLYLTTWETPASIVRIDINDFAGRTKSPYPFVGDGSQLTGIQAGVTDHTQLTNIGTNTHDDIDTHISATNPHSDSASKSVDNHFSSEQSFDENMNIGGGFVIRHHYIPFTAAWLDRNCDLSGTGIAGATESVGNHDVTSLAQGNGQFHIPVNIGANTDFLYLGWASETIAGFPGLSFRSFLSDVMPNCPIAYWDGMQWQDNWGRTINFAGTNGDGYDYWDIGSLGEWVQDSYSNIGIPKPTAAVDPGPLYWIRVAGGAGGSVPDEGTLIMKLGVMLTNQFASYYSHPLAQSTIRSDSNDGGTIVEYCETKALRASSSDTLKIYQNGDLQTPGSSTPAIRMGFAADDYALDILQDGTVVFPVGRLRIPSGTSYPASPGVGDTFLKTNDGTNGTLYIYSNGGWRVIKAL